jgi:hypothetical protein
VALSVAGMLATLTCEAAVPSCFVDLPVYGPQGDRMSFVVKSVRLKQGDKELDFLSINNSEYRMVAVGDRLYFPQQAVTGDLLTVTLEDSTGEIVKGQVALVSCQQRISFRHGINDSGIDGATKITGYLIGCKLSAEWWVRAMPMFGGFESPTVYEGPVSSSDGFFSLMGMFGERLIVVFGRGKEPAKAIAVDAVQGDRKDMGIVDLNGSCPP